VRSTAERVLCMARHRVSRSRSPAGLKIEGCWRELLEGGFVEVAWVLLVLRYDEDGAGSMPVGALSLKAGSAVVEGRRIES
jgi:hypothetical protein